MTLACSPSRAFDPDGPVGIATRSSQNAINNMIEKMIPAIAAALGVLRLLFVTLSWCDISGLS
jgi:hypothetical protein